MSTPKLDTLAAVNDLGKPWRYEEDGLTVTRTAVWSPPGCHPVGCGLKLYTKDNKLVRVEGMKIIRLPKDAFASAASA